MISSESCASDPTHFSAVRYHYQQTTELLLDGKAEITYPNINKKDLQVFRDTYGTSAYVCRFLHCIFSSDGFESSSRRAKHESQHQRRFRCAHSSCVHFARGFVSRSLLNKHNEWYHSVVVEGPSVTECLMSTPNSFASFEVTNRLATWLQDRDKVYVDAGVDPEDVFQYLKVPTDQLKWPKLRVERKESTINNTTLRWRQLITPTNLPHAGRIGKLNGTIGFQRDYCDDVKNSWKESTHPRPFVFFHPRLPLYIDTRKEGSICRYVRRSCQPNTNLDTFISLGNEYHFWLTSERPFAANEQITIPWDFRFPGQYRSRYLHLLYLSDDGGAPFDGADVTDEEYATLSAKIDMVLSDHSGCACDLGNDCAFARFHRSYHGRSHTQSNGVRSKKGRKPKQNHFSLTSTGHATNSRAASKGQQEQYDDDDSRSVSDSIRSKPHSRDLTPSQGAGETNGILTEPSDREKRKLAMLEESFRKMEQWQPSRKKNRASDTSTANISANTPQSTPKPRQRSVAPSEV